MKKLFSTMEAWKASAPASIKIGTILFFISWALQAYFFILLEAPITRLHLTHFQTQGAILIITIASTWLILGIILLVGMFRGEQGARLIALLFVVSGGVYKIAIDHRDEAQIISLMLLSYAAAVACLFTTASNAWFSLRDKKR